MSSWLVICIRSSKIFVSLNQPFWSLTQLVRFSSELIWLSDNYAVDLALEGDKSMVFLEIRYTNGMEINDQNPLEMPSNQKFGWLFSLIFSLAALYSLKKDLLVLLALSISFAIIFTLVTITRPSTLAPFNRAWFKLSIALGKLVSPIVLGLIFFVVISPVALISRFFGRDELLMKKRLAASYWIDKEPIEPQSFKDQY